MVSSQNFNTLCLQKGIYYVSAVTFHKKLLRLTIAKIAAATNTNYLNI